MSEIVIQGKVYQQGSFDNCCIGIDNGKITQIKKILKGDINFDFGNKVILPAGVDAHVHFREPGLIHKEDWHTGSTAAAFGGISCVFDMPNTLPQTTTVQTVKDKISIASDKSLVDFGIYSGITNENINLVEKLGKLCNGFKIFLGSSALSLAFDKKRLREAFDLAGIAEKPVFVHAEDEECLIKNKNVEQDLTDHMRFRPSECEEISIREVLKAANGLNAQIHICHVTSCESLELLKKRPRNVSFGITPHHSLLSIDKSLGSPGLYKVNPPIRSGFNKDGLFNALKSGLADIIESDHAPHTLDEKDGIFDEVASGVPGVETVYPLFLYLVKKEVLSFQRIVSLLCNRPANLLGINKGSISPGFDADLIVVDLKNESKIKAENLHSRCGWSPFEDWPAIFPETVFVRGEKLIEDNEIHVKQGFGKFVGA